MNSILSLGFVLLIGLLLAKLINKLKFPSITAYLLLGIFVGPSMLSLISRDILSASSLISNIVLSMVAFSLGQNFTKDFFRNIGRAVLWVSILEAILPWILVTMGVYILLKQPFYIAILFGAISAATAPAATVMVIREYRSKGRFTDILLGVVAIDDAWCLIVFALSLSVSKAVAFHSSNNVIMRAIFHSFFEIIIALFLGGIIACTAKILSRFIRTQIDFLIYTLGCILLTTGIAITLGVSVLLANMFLGTFLVNINRDSYNFFDSLKNFEPPLYLLFFVLAGANLEIALLKNIGVLGLIYILFRSLGKIIGSFCGGWIVKVEDKIKKYIGLGLLPQAGVAIGCALIAKSNFPEVGDVIFTTIVATTVIYELIGPVCTKYALYKAGDIIRT